MLELFLSLRRGERGEGRGGEGEGRGGEGRRGEGRRGELGWTIHWSNCSWLHGSAGTVKLTKTADHLIQKQFCTFE